jgi:hypothetical protein
MPKYRKIGKRRQTITGRVPANEKCVPIRSFLESRALRYGRCLLSYICPDAPIHGPTPNGATIARPMPAIKKMVPWKPFGLLRALSLSKRLLGGSGRLRHASHSSERIAQGLARPPTAASHFRLLGPSKLQVLSPATRHSLAAFSAGKALRLTQGLEPAETAFKSGKTRDFKRLCGKTLRTRNAMGQDETIP